MGLDHNTSSIPLIVPYMNEAVENLDKVSGLMTSAQIAEAQRMAREWRKKHPQ